MPTTTIQTFPKRQQLEVVKEQLAAQVNATIANGFVCQQGDVLGKITSSGFYRRRSRATVGATAFATNSPSGTVDDASVFAVGDVLTNAAGGNVGTVLAVNTTTNTITLSANAATAVATGAGVLASDGSQKAEAIADAGSDGTADTSLSAFITGLLDPNKLRGLDTTAVTELSGKLAAGVFVF